MYTVREHQMNCQTGILYLCYTSGLCLCLCHKNIPRYKYTNHMIYMYIICIIWNVYFTVNTLYLVICSIVPPILKYNSNPISEKPLLKRRFSSLTKTGIHSAWIPGSCVLYVWLENTSRLRVECSFLHLFWCCCWLLNVTKLDSLIFNMMALVWPVFIHQSKCCKLIKRLLNIFSC